MAEVSAPDEVTLLTAVQVVYRECFQDEFPHVARRIDAFLGDFDPNWTLASAYEHIGSLRFLKLLAARANDQELEPLYRLWQFNNVVSLVAARGDLQTITWLARTYLPAASLTLAAAAAAGSGHLQILEWLLQEHHDRVHWGGLEWCEAVKGGHKEIVNWLRIHVAIHADAGSCVMFKAARAGNLDVVKWLLDEYELPAIGALKGAQEGRQWHVVQWVLVSCDVGNHAVDADAAAIDGELEFLQWAYQHGSIELGGRDLLNTVAFNGHLHVLKWLHDGPANIELGAAVFAQAARSGNLEMIEWLHSRQCPATAAAMDHAAERGFLEVLKWLDANREEGCTSRAMDGAARNGHLEVVKWLHNSGKSFYCPFAMNSAATNGHLEVVKWLHDHRSEGCTAYAMDWAAAYGHLDVVKWLHVHRREGCTSLAMDSAAREGHLDVVKWLHENRDEGCSPMALTSASGSGHLDMVRWLHDNRSEGCTSTTMARAIAAGHFDVVLFLRDKRLIKVRCAPVNFIECPPFELLQWLLENEPAACEGVRFRLPRGHWYMNEWVQRHNLRQTYQDDQFNDWVWEGQT